MAFARSQDVHLAMHITVNTLIDPSETWGTTERTYLSSYYEVPGFKNGNKKAAEIMMEHS